MRSAILSDFIYIVNANQSGSNIHDDLEKVQARRLSRTADSQARDMFVTFYGAMITVNKMSSRILSTDIVLHRPPALVILIKQSRRA